MEDNTEDLTAAYMLGKYDGRKEAQAANSRCSASAGSVPHYEGKFKAGYTEEQKRLAYEIWNMLEDGKPLGEVNRKRCELNRMMSQNNKCADDEAQRSR